MIECLGVHRFLDDDLWAAVDIPGKHFSLSLERLPDESGCVVTIEGYPGLELQDFWHNELPDILAQVSAGLLDASMAHALIHKAILSEGGEG